MARKVLDKGFFISFTGNVTFKNFRGKDVLEYVPADRLLLETDSRFLTPVAFRGKRNEPAYLPYIAEKIAAVKNMDRDELVEITDGNAARLFGIEARSG
jgi:TatD DNase family protein